MGSVALAHHTPRTVVVSSSDSNSNNVAAEPSLAHTPRTVAYTKTPRQ